MLDVLSLKFPQLNEQFSETFLPTSMYLHCTPLAIQLVVHACYLSIDILRQHIF